MKSTKFFICLLICISLLSFSCAEEERTKPAMISAYTSGIVSRAESIRIVFKEDIIDSSQLNAPITDPAVYFKPEIKGVALWTNTRTLEFRPDTWLPSDKAYKAIIDLPQLIDADEKFSFEFTTLRQSLDITIDGLKTIRQDDLKEQQLNGKLITADAEHGVNVEKIIEASQKGKHLDVKWQHDTHNRDHSFTIDGIIRGDNPSEVILKWNGDPIGVDKKGERKIEIAPVSRFAILQVNAHQGMEQFIELRFTDPLKKDQDLKGLITVAGENDLRYSIDTNIVRMYKTSPWIGKVTVTIEEGIRNSMGHRLTASKKADVFFEERKPQVRFTGKGVIIPTTEGLTVPIETVNLRAVIVEATQVYEDNIPQFLQVNTLEGNRELSRVGRVVWKKVVPLNWKESDRDRWVTTGLDMTPLVKKNSGGIFKIKLSFTRRHIVYGCTDTAEEQTADNAETTLDAADEEQESSYWDTAEEIQQDEDYDYYEYHEQRNNPCHKAYYKEFHDHNITVSRNVLISDIGLIAKQGSDGRLFIAATDIKTAKQLSGVSLSVLDFQQQVICEGKTDGDGTALLEVDRTPFLIIAKNGDQTGYLKVDDGSALSVSHFDTSGEILTKGLKGFLYGERGVWRPGDPIYLTFILLDKEDKLPENHPVLFQLRNPKGQIVQTMARDKSINRFYHFKTSTDPDAPTGNWTARIEAGGAVFEKGLKIETVMPNRLKINLDFGADTKSLSGGTLKGELSAKWLHGAIAKNLKSDVDVSFTSAKTTFPKYGEYEFDDPARQYEPETQNIFEGELDDQGKTALSARINVQNVSPGMLTANFRARVFEPSGAFSIDRFSIPYHPYERYIGIRVPKGDKARSMLLTDTDHSVKIAMLDSNGRPVKSGRIEMELYKIKWRWWWEKESESLADYVGSSSYRPLETKKVTITNGIAEWKFNIKYPSWGRYLIRARDLDGRHIAGKIIYVDWPGWAGRAQKDIPGGASVLSFSSDKEEYNVNETVMLTIPTGNKGRGLISIESGNKIIQTDWLSADKESVRYEFKATREMAPNVYVHVTFLQPHMQTANDLPIRMYGVIPIKVVDPATQLKPVIQAAEVFEPESTAKITISEEKGKPMTYTVAIVDEGLLDLTRFETPDPWNHFYKREALGVKTWDLYDIVAGAYGGKLEQLLSIGGDGQADGEKQKKANRFPPMVKFIGPFELGKNKEKTHEISIPQYIGSVRVMVIAGGDKSFGSSEKTAFVRKPLMILGTLPRVLGPEEEVDLPVSVFALERKVKRVTTSVQTTGPISVIGSNRKELAFLSPGDDMITFKLKAGSKPGLASIVMAAAGGGETAGHKIELDVRMPGGKVTDVIKDSISSKASWKKKITFPGVAGTNEATLEMSRIPPLNLGKHLKFLIRYPHGCVEQVTSSVFPQLYLNKLIDISTDKQIKIEHNIKAGIDRLRTFQASDGGFAYWPGEGQGDDWASSYAGHFLVEAEKIGYIIPQGMMDQWKKYQRSKALSWVAGPARSELIQAYRLYTLALAGSPELSAMNRLKEAQHIPADVRWRLAAAYQLAGQPEAAEELTRNAKLIIDRYLELSNTYGSSLRDKAMILESICLMDKMKRAQQLADEIADEIGGDEWQSTQTTAYVLIAMARYAGISAHGEKVEFKFSLNDGKKISVSSNSPIAQQELEVGNATEAKIIIENTGKTTLYPRLILEGIPAMGAETAAQNGMEIHVKYLSHDSRTNVDPSKLEQGTDFVATVEVKNTGRTGRYEEVALTHVFPSGWEIHNTRMDAGAIGADSTFDYQDIRDDRVYTYFDIDQGQTKTFHILLNASYLGKFYLPMVTVETMYDTKINARIPGRWISVVNPGTKD